MNKSLMVLSVLALVTLACGACSYTVQGKWDPTRKALTGVVTRGGGVGPCTLPPKTFQESDLVGTWVVKYGNGGTDTLILEEDGTYKQIYNNPTTGDRYEGNWQEWQLEPRQSGIFYLHLKGMQKCNGLREDCLREGGGGGYKPWDSWVDFCEGRGVEMHGEVILMVLGTPKQFKQPPRGIELWHLESDPDTVTPPFLLQP